MANHTTNLTQCLGCLATRVQIQWYGFRWVFFSLHHTVDCTLNKPKRTSAILHHNLSFNLNQKLSQLITSWHTVDVLKGIIFFFNILSFTLLWKFIHNHLIYIHIHQHNTSHHLVYPHSIQKIINFLINCWN